jgi:hypothetical protein
MPHEYVSQLLQQQALLATLLLSRGAEVQNMKGSATARPCMEHVMLPCGYLM